MEQTVFYSLASAVTQQTAQLSTREPKIFYKQLGPNYCSESPMIFCNLNQIFETFTEDFMIYYKT